MPRKFNLNSRTITAPLAAFCMASLLFVYSRTSIQAAKRNAQKHREADGGQINWHNESLRRHGKLDAPEEQSTVVQLLKGGREKTTSKSEPEKEKEREKSETAEERRIRERKAKGT